MVVAVVTATAAVVVVDVVDVVVIDEDVESNLTRPDLAPLSELSGLRGAGPSTTSSSTSGPMTEVDVGWNDDDDDGEAAAAASVE